MASKKFVLGDRVQYLEDGKPIRGTVCEPTSVDKSEDFPHSDVAVWANWDDDDWGPGWMPEDKVTLVEKDVVTCNHTDTWRTVTEEEQALVKSLFNESVEFRIQVRVKGSN